jgi:hypothetical protein
MIISLTMALISDWLLNNYNLYNSFTEIHMDNKKTVEQTSVNGKQRYVVWALYDDAKSCYKQAFDKYFSKQYVVHCVGINDLHFKNYHRIDLSIMNNNLIKQLSALPKPDFILASPPCESWSGADCGGRIWDSDMHLRNRKYYDEYNKKCHKVKRRDYYQKTSSMLLGIATITATVKIIEYFKPKHWVIENPQTSKTWFWQNKHLCFRGFENLTYYSSYNKKFSPKPTIFKSDIPLKLKKIKMPGNKEHMLKSNYSLRSSIPLSLIKDVISSMTEDVK